MNVWRSLEDQEVGNDATSKPWGGVILASLFVMLATLTGIFVLGSVTSFGRISRMEFSPTFVHRIHKIIIPSFAAGALLATAVFLIIPESIALIGGGGHEAEGDEHVHRRFLEDHAHEEHSDESAFAWKFGASLIGGFLFPILVGGLLHSHNHIELPNRTKSGTDVAVKNVDSDSLGVSNAKDLEAAQENAIKEEEMEDSDEKCDIDVCCEDKDNDINWSLTLSIMIGDAIHNFCDGVFIGTAFLLCGRETAFAIVATTVYHELAQEISDYALLLECGWSKMSALALNFVSGFSVLFGALLALALDFTDVATGCILAVSSGVFIYLAASICIPRIEAATRNPKDTLCFLACFIVGAVPIGLVLLNHQHCETEHRRR